MNFWRRLFSPPPAVLPAAAPASRPIDDALLSGLEEGVLRLDRARRVRAANPPLAAYLNRPPQNAVGAFLWEVLRHRDVTALVDEVQRGGAPAPKDVVFSAAEERIARVGAHALPDGGVLLTFLDLTHTRRLENLRREFVANVSHELKTPLTALRASIETLLDGALEDAAHARDFLDTALQQVQRLQRLIDDVLTLSRLERSAEPPSDARCDAAAVARRVADTFSALARRRDLALKIDLPPALPARLSDDELSQVLINLVDNAFKFSLDGGTVHLRGERRDPDIVLEVEDTGIGIPPEHLSRVFERFFRGDPARTSQAGGTGLGLAIVKHTIERRGGAVSVDSAPGRGSRFRIRLPSATDERAAPPSRR